MINETKVLITNIIVKVMESWLKHRENYHER